MKKHTFKKAAALFLGIALTVGATGCGFITTDNQADLGQTVATVDISGKLASDAKYKNVAGEVGTIVDKLSKDVTKRDLISYYLSTGYNYVEQYGYSYEDTFNMLLDGLVSREIMIQYAVAYYLNKYENVTAAACQKFIDDTIAAEKDAKTKALLSEHQEVLVLKYFLSVEEKEDEKGNSYDKAVYTLKKTLNDSLDSLEESYITAAEEEEEAEEEARTLPTGVDTEKEDYYTNNYNIYTGRNVNTDCGEYEVLDGSTRTSRQKAYNAFLTNLQAYNLINVDKKKGEVEDTQDITKLHYYYVELASILGQSLINQYFESLENEVSGKLDATYMAEKYNETKAQNEEDYAKDPTAFASALDSAAEGNYLLYGLDGYGYVYNILIPFSTEQNIRYTEAKNRGLKEGELFARRRELTQKVEAIDLRDTWISEHEHANYAYEKDGKTYFFKDNLGENSKYEQLDHYAGNYAYDETKYLIDGFIGKFNAYVSQEAGVTVTGDVCDAYTNADFTDAESANYYKNTTTGKIDYSKFTYYMGQVNFATEDVKASDYFNRESKQYKALSAVNELLFAYGTDPGAFNSYMGYSVSPYTTNYVKEFEWAAHEVVKAGVGSYAVCETDYGWHLLYCSFKYDTYNTDGDVYGGYVEADKDKEGTFSNLFYETIKEAAYNNHATEEQNRVIKEYNVGACVERFEKAYKDLLEMDKKS